MFIKGRLTFYHATGQKARYNGGAPSALIAYGKTDAEILDACSLEGKVFHNSATIVIVGVSPSWFSVVSMAVRYCGEEDLQPIYDYVETLAPDKVANNYNWKAKIRQKVGVYKKKVKQSPQTLFN